MHHQGAKRMNWDCEMVVRSFEEYKEGKITSLGQLKSNLKELTGVDRLPDRRSPRAADHPSPPLSFTDAPFTAPLSFTSVKRSTRLPLSSGQVSENRTQFSEGVLSKRLTSNNVTIPVGNGFVRNFRLTNRNKDGSVKHYRCSRCDSLYRKLKTGVRATLSIKCGVLTIHQALHQPDCQPLKEMQAIAADIDKKCRKAVREGNVAPRDAYNKGHDDALHFSGEAGDARSGDSAAVLFPDWTAVRKQYGHHRRGTNAIVKSLYNLPDVYRITLRGLITTDNERWLLHSCETEDVVVFAGDTELRMAAECSTLVGDATFSTSPKGIYQLYILHCKFCNTRGESEWIAVVFALMKRKTRSAYESVFGAVRDKWVQLGCAPKFTTMLMDFEPAELDAAAKVFGRDKVKGCLFHHTQCILKQVRKKGLIRYYTGGFGSQNVIWSWIRSICALPFLPPKLACFVWHLYLCHPPAQPVGWVPPKGFGGWPVVELQSFVGYVQGYWFGTVPLMTWNHWSSQTDRTTNAAEAFHSVLSKQSAALKKPSLSNFMPWLQKLHSRLQTRLMQLQKGDKVRPKDKRYRKIDGVLEQYKREFTQQILQSTDIAGRMFLCERFLVRCAYKLAHADSSGNKTRKGAGCAQDKGSDANSKPVKKRAVKSRRSSKGRHALTKKMCDDDLVVSNEVTVSTLCTVLDGTAISMEISADDLMSLSGREWLNDIIIENYLHLIDLRSSNEGCLCSLSFKTYFYVQLCSRGYIGVSSWTKNVDIFDKDMLFFPLHVNTNHWTLIVVDLRQRDITYFDSKGGNGSAHLQRINLYLQAEHAARRKTVAGFRPFTLLHRHDCPRQSNTWDCGVFVCQFAEHLSRASPFSFTEMDMPAFRLKMRREILQGHLLIN